MNRFSALETDGATKLDEFSEMFQRKRGVGVIFNPKLYVVDFRPFFEHLPEEFAT